MTDRTNLLLETYEGIVSAAVESPKEAPPNAVASYKENARSAYLRSAAVLHHFIPEDLKPYGELAPMQYGEESITFDAAILLFDDCVRVTGSGSERIFTLKLDVRREILSRFDSLDEMLEAIKSNPDRIMTDQQQAWESYLRTRAVPDPESLGYAQLTHLFQISGWLEGIDKNFPGKDYLLELVNKRSVLASFEHLVISNFTGRESEIQMIRAHIGLPTERFGLDAVRDHIGQWLGKAPELPILSIFGPGGIGKSALIGKVLWDMARSSERIPFAYLAFDQPRLKIDDPFTILVEAVAQFELQFPQQKQLFERFHSIVRDFRDIRGSLQNRIASQSTRGARISEVRKADELLSRSFCDLLNELGMLPEFGERRPVPVLLVLDTFEEVQYRDRESLFAFWQMLSFIGAAYPSFRAVLCGRAPIPESNAPPATFTQKELEGLTMPDRISLLTALGVANTTLAESVAHQIGGNPLSLRLAASVIATDLDSITEQGISGLNTQKWFLFQIDEKIIQGQLYRRILDHIHNEDVRKLAHPGMVLRRIDPDLIMNLLAPFCGITIARPSQADALFEELKREHGLVKLGNDGFLEYRPEVRLSVLKLLQQDRPREVRSLHEAAIDYYAKKDGPSARAEEIYHRLVLDQEPSELSNRWVDDIEQSIVKSVEEYPDRAKAWIASRFSLEVPRSVFIGADAAEWERNITRKIQVSLSHYGVESALSLLNERSERTTNSPLFALEAKAYFLQEDYVRARQVLLKGIDRVAESRNRGRLAELFWLISQVEILEGDYIKADSYLENAESVLTNAANPLPLMHVLCHRILLRQVLNYVGNDESEKSLNKRLSEASLRLADEHIGSARYVVAQVVSLVAAEYPKSAEHLEALVGHTDPSMVLSRDLLTSDNLQGLDEYREPWEISNIPGEEALA